MTGIKVTINIQCLVLMGEDTCSFGKAVIRELLVLVCLLLRDGLTVLSMWSESMTMNDNEITFFDIIQKQHYYIKYKQICVNIMSWRSY